MVEAILILNMIILVVVLLMVPTVLEMSREVLDMSQNVSHMHTAPQMIREMHDYTYELKRRELVQEHEERFAKHLNELKEWAEFDESNYLTRSGHAFANYDEDDDGHDAHVYARQVNQREEEWDEQNSFLIGRARWEIYDLACIQRGYSPRHPYGADPEWPDGEENFGYHEDWRFQSVDSRYHKSYHGWAYMPTSR